jgi:hypothetical protein
MHEQRVERIRQRAHAIFLRRGGAQGDEVSDWLQAEEEICSEDERRQQGPARIRDRNQWGHLTEPSGHDVENPT